MRESEAVAAWRRDLGRQLAERRVAAGYVQRELGVLLGYSRSVVANAEVGGTNVGRQFWERADRVFGAGELFARGYDRIREQVAAESRAKVQQRAPAVPPAGSGAGGVESLSVGEAREAYLGRGWPVEEDADGRLWLVTGTVVDVLEVPRPAGVLAMGWWLYTRGLPDEIRGLPALPDPANALAVVAAGSVCYFLARSGDCPWSRHDAGAGGVAGAAGPAVVRWHAEGGRVILPPSWVEGGEAAAWAHGPSDGVRLASPLALLHVLAQAAAATSGGAGLVLPGGVRAVPARGAGEGRNGGWEIQRAPEAGTPR